MTLSTFKNNLKEQINSTSPKEVIAALKKNLQTNHPLVNELISIEFQYNLALNSQSYNTITPDIYSREISVVIKKIMDLIDALESSDLKTMGFAIKKAHAYSKEWDDNRDWYISKKGKLLTLVKAKLGMDLEDGLLYQVSNELTQIMDFLEEYIDDAPRGGYTKWIQAKIINSAFESKNLSLLNRGIDTLSDAIESLSNETGKPPLNVVKRFKNILNKTKEALISNN